MEFIKTFNITGGHGRKAGDGSLVITKGKLIIKINNNKSHIVQIGRTEEGIGVIIEPDNDNRRTPFIQSMFKYENDYIPENFQYEEYRFRIPATKLSDTEYEFKFCNAKMLNKK